MAQSKPDPYQELEDAIACPLCLERCTEPHSLPCLHTYCLSCLDLLVQKSGQRGTFLCPTCRQEVNVPEGGIKDLPKAFIWNTLTETVDKLKELSVHQKPQCSLCLDAGKHVDATTLCTDCMQTYCNDCLANIHNRMMKHHNVVSCENITSDDLNAILKTKPDKCPKHKEDMKLFCETCCELVCMMCAVLDHNTHNNQEL